MTERREPAETPELLGEGRGCGWETKLACVLVEKRRCAHRGLFNLYKNRCDKMLSQKERFREIERVRDRERDTERETERDRDRET